MNHRRHRCADKVVDLLALAAYPALIVALTVGVIALAAWMLWPKPPCPGRHHEQTTMVLMPVGKVLVPEWITETVCDS